jgi:hypothetical protein
MKRALVTLVLVTIVGLLVVPFAAADPCCGGRNNNDDCGNGNGNATGHNNCANAPEAPATLLFPLAAIAVVGGYVLLTRRRPVADH